MVMNQLYIYNETGTIELTVWESWIDFLQENNGKCFEFCNLLVKDFNGEISVSTCSDTTIKVVQSDIENLKSPVSITSDKPIKI